MSATPTRSDVRAGVLARRGLRGAALRAALADALDEWLRGLAADLPHGVALAAVGGLGRREPAPQADLDLILLHSGAVDGVAELAESIWYPVWDSGIALDHSVRTPADALDVARADLTAMLGLLDLRHLAGDAALTAGLRTQLLDVWRATASRRSAELGELAGRRWQVAGDAAHLLEPNLKQSRGGLRDAQVLRALAAAQLVDVPGRVRAARSVLLDVRCELQRLAGRREDVLRLQEQAGIAEALGLPGADAVLRSVNEAARTVALALVGGLRTAAAAQPGGRGLRRILVSRPPARTPLAEGVVAQDGEVVLARDADPAADPLLLLRAARASAEHGQPLAPFTLARLAAESAPLAVPWPAPALEEFTSLLGAGPGAVPVLETLDEAGLLAALLPEWGTVRFLAQHNPVHRFTVDRHLLETAAHAAGLARRVARPDLLLLGALLHDIGKGVADGDHSVTGAALAERAGRRMGLPPTDLATVVALVRHHLLLADTATRRDPDDPATVRIVTDAVAGSGELLELLHALTVADGLATGPAAWSDWRAGLVTDLVDRTRAVLGGVEPPRDAPFDAARRRLADAGRLAVEVHGGEVVIAARDGLGVLSRAAGVLALHSLDVRSASIRTHAGMAVNSFAVEPRFGGVPDPALIRADLARALAVAPGGPDGPDGPDRLDRMDLEARLAAKERAYAGSANPPAGPPEVRWFDGEATGVTIIELRAADAIGLLCRVTAALERCGVNIRSARLSSFGRSVVDAFYVTAPAGGPVPAAARPGIAAALRRAVVTGPAAPRREGAG